MGLLSAFVGLDDFLGSPANTTVAEETTVVVHPLQKVHRLSQQCLSLWIADQALDDLYSGERSALTLLDDVLCYLEDTEILPVGVDPLQRHVRSLDENAGGLDAIGVVCLPVGHLALLERQSGFESLQLAPELMVLGGRVEIFTGRQAELEPLIAVPRPDVSVASLRVYRQEDPVRVLVARIGIRTPLQRGHGGVWNRKSCDRIHHFRDLATRRPGVSTGPGLLGDERVGGFHLPLARPRSKLEHSGTP